MSEKIENLRQRLEDELQREMFILSGGTNAVPLIDVNRLDEEELKELAKKYQLGDE